MKTYVLLLAKTFMKGHSREGQPTNFEQKIRDGIKIHTLRTNYNYWKNIVDQVNDGKAILSVRQWTGKPYNSKQIELMQFTKLGIEQALITVSNIWIKSNHKNNLISNNFFNFFCKNDGLEISDFLEWFKKNPKETHKILPIIHFTVFRYKNNHEDLM